MNQPYQILKRAPRRPDGGVIGVPPPVIVPRILRVLSREEQAKLKELDARRADVNADFKVFLESLGLPSESGITYTFGRNGEVRARGIHAPRY